MRNLNNIQTLSGQLFRSRQLFSISQKEQGVISPSPRRYSLFQFHEMLQLKCQCSAGSPIVFRMRLFTKQLARQFKMPLTSIFKGKPGNDFVFFLFPFFFLFAQPWETERQSGNSDRSGRFLLLLNNLRAAKNLTQSFSTCNKCKCKQFFCGKIKHCKI